MELAEKVYQAADTATNLDTFLTELYPDVTVEDAYAMQMVNIDRRVKNGSRIIGKKVGLTSKAMQELLNVDEPDYGHLLDDMGYFPGEGIPMSTLIQPRVEMEIAFLLKEDLQGPGLNQIDVLRATEAIFPSMEVIDNRYRDWTKLTVRDTISDNAGAALYVLGTELTNPAEIDMTTLGGVFEKNGEVIATATGAAVLGNPAIAIAWLANKLGAYGVPLKAGEVVLSGALTAALPAAKGDVFTVRFAELGSVTTRFV
ncbi:MAG TPA: 2-keto-4-pentenoate hydratase [Firmicutes bacterium]|nr:2-keto-4-pentenoate hydratase [Bacillota bacterium]